MTLQKRFYEIVRRNKLLALTLSLVLMSCYSSRVTSGDTKPAKILSFTFNRFQIKDTLRFAECTLRNNTDSVFWILAYDTTQTQGKTYIRPIFSLQEKKNGKWKLSDLGFSGIGIERFSLSKGEEFFFETPDFDSTAEAIRIGIEMRMRTSEDKLRTVREIWTDEITLH